MEDHNLFSKNTRLVLSSLNGKFVHVLETLDINLKLLCGDKHISKTMGKLTRDARSTVESTVAQRRGISLPLRLFNVFKGWRKGALGTNGLILLLTSSTN